MRGYWLAVCCVTIWWLPCYVVHGFLCGGVNLFCSALQWGGAHESQSKGTPPLNTTKCVKMDKLANLIVHPSLPSGGRLPGCLGGEVRCSTAISPTSCCP